MVKRVRGASDGFIQLVGDPIWDVWSDSRLYENIGAGTAPARIKVNVSPDCEPDDMESDFIGFGTVHIVASPSADDQLIKMLDASCHRFELVSPAKIYWAYLPKTFYDAFDAEKSVYDRFEHEPHNISNMKNMVLRESALGDAPVFKVSGEHGLQFPTFVSESFYKLYTQQVTTGLRFWDVDLS